MRLLKIEKERDRPFKFECLVQELVPWWKVWATPKTGYGISVVSAKDAETRAMREFIGHNIKTTIMEILA